jgi:hypothetical protein
MLIFYFIFVCFVWRGKQAPSSGASLKLLGFGACLLQLNPATHQAPELACCNVASFGAFWLRSVRACCCNAASSGACPAPKFAATKPYNTTSSRACPAPKFAATKPYNAASSGASLAVEEKEKEPWTFCPILNIFYFALV